jgi:pantothenate kinase type III
MNFIVDIGNSNTVIGIYKDEFSSEDGGSPLTGTSLSMTFLPRSTH